MVSVFGVRGHHRQLRSGALVSVSCHNILKLAQDIRCPDTELSPLLMKCHVLICFQRLTIYKTVASATSKITYLLTRRNLEKHPR